LELNKDGKTAKRVPGQPPAAVYLQEDKKAKEASIEETTFAVDKHTAYHRECIDGWLNRNNSTDPLTRATIVPYKPVNNYKWVISGTDINGVELMSGSNDEDFREEAPEFFFPPGIVHIGKKAGQHCYGVTNITIPEGVKTIADYAFNGCTNVETVTVPSSLESLGKSVFGGIGKLKVIDLSGTEIKDTNSFFVSGCGNLETVLLPTTLETIGAYAFSNCKSMKKIDFTHTILETMDQYVFSNCVDLETILFPSPFHIDEGYPIDVGGDCFNLCTTLVGGNWKMVRASSSSEDVMNYLYNKQYPQEGTFNYYRSCREIMERYGLKFVNTTVPKVGNDCMCRFEDGWFYGRIQNSNDDHRDDDSDDDWDFHEDVVKADKEGVMLVYNWNDQDDTPWDFQDAKRLGKDDVDVEMMKEGAVLKKSEEGQWFIVEQIMRRS
jgi:hypothetical protein